VNRAGGGFTAAVLSHHRSYGSTDWTLSITRQYQATALRYDLACTALPPAFLQSLHPWFFLKIMALWFD